MVFKGFEGHTVIEELLVNLPGGVWGLIIISQLLIFVLGFFIDFFERLFYSYFLLKFKTVVFGNQLTSLTKIFT